MPDKLKVVELDRRTVDARNKSLRIRDDRDRLDRQFVAALNGRRRAYEQGFVAALHVLAGGTRDFVDGEEPTAPYPIIDPTLLEVD